MTRQPFINTTNDSLSVYLTKVISTRAKLDPRIANLAIGEPEFGPPPHLREAIGTMQLTYDAFHRAAKTYEEARGLRELRIAIARWYEQRYNLSIDPETELLITHGGVEALALAMLCTSDPGDHICTTDPTYMLYARSARTLARHSLSLIRRPISEYVGMMEDPANITTMSSPGIRALIVNSPENPTGHVISSAEWRSLAEFAERYNVWVIHDEVYDTMAFLHPHLPARCVSGLEDRAILVNSFSKKFGVPGLRIGWLCAPTEIISLAAKLHDYLYLGVNILFENIAAMLLQDPESDLWLRAQKSMLETRARTVVSLLDESYGYSWDRVPEGGMFAFPNIKKLCQRNCTASSRRTPAETVADFLLQQRQVAVVPGSIYGSQGNESIRLVLCSSEATLETALYRLRNGE